MTTDIRWGTPEMKELINAAQARWERMVAQIQEEDPDWIPFTQQPQRATDKKWTKAETQAVLRAAAAKVERLRAELKVEERELREKKLRKELAQAAQQRADDLEKIALLEGELHETKQQLTQRDTEVAALEEALELVDEHDQRAAQDAVLQDTLQLLAQRDDEVAALQHALALATTMATANANTNATETTARRGDTASATPSANLRRCKAKTPTTAPRGEAVPVRTTATGKTTGTRPQPPKKPTTTTKPTATPAPPKKPMGQPLHWTVLECVRAQERAGHALALILQDLQATSGWRVVFKDNVMWVVLVDDDAASARVVSSASVVHALIDHAKRLGTLKEDCDGQLTAVSHTKRGRPWLATRQKKLLQAIVHVRKWIVALITTLRQTSASESAHQDEDNACVLQWHTHVVPKPTDETVLQQAATRAMVKVSTAALQSAVLAVRGFHMDCLGAWAASLPVDESATRDVDLMQYGVSVLREIKSRAEQQAEPCPWLDETALATKLASAVAQIDTKLVYFITAVARYEEVGGYDDVDDMASSYYSSEASWFHSSEEDLESSFDPVEDLASTMDPSEELAHLDVLYLLEDLMGESASEITQLDV